MEKPEIEQQNNTTETIPLKEDLAENIPSVIKLEEYFDDSLSVKESTVNQIQELGGDKHILMTRLEPIMEKMKGVIGKVRSRAKVLTLAAGTALFAGGLIGNKENHHPIEASRDNPEMVKERSGAYVEGKSEWFAEHISPFGYTLIGVDKIIIDNTIGKIPHGKSNTARYDAWYLYLGLEQENGTFAVSPYQPSTSMDTNMTYYRIPEKEDFIVRYGLRELAKSGKDKIVIQDNKPKIDIDDSLAQYMPKHYIGVMGQYTVSKGEDEKGSYISYYDKWDLKPGGIFGKREASEMAGVGKPFEIYGRIYYDPATGNPLKID